jgi:spermidine/putrescine transport system permease protein
MRRPRHVFVAIVAVLGFAFLYVPIGAIILNAFNADEQLLAFTGATVKWFGQALGDAEFRGALGMSLIIGAVVGVVSVAIAFLAALARRRSTLRIGRVDDIGVILRMVLPEIVVVMALFLVAHLLRIDLGLPLVIGAQVVYCSAYAYLVIAGRLRQLSEHYEAAAADLGAPAFSTFVRVTLPLVFPSIIVAFLLAFTFSLDDVLSPTFLGGTSVETVPTMVMGLVRHGVTAQVNAIAVIVMLVSLLPLVAALLVTGLRNLGATTSVRRNDSQ